MFGFGRHAHGASKVGRRITALAAVAVLSAPIAVLGAALPTPPAASVQSITPTDLRMHLEFLASPELGGRYTLSQGNYIAARYLASRLQAYGFRGAMPDGSFLQPFDVVESKVDAAKTNVTLAVNGKSSTYAYGDFGVFDSGAGTVEAPLVFAGYGISAPDLGHDDYAGLDVKGKIVVIAPGTPKGIDSSKIGDARQDEAAAAAHGAAGVITFASPRYAALASSPNYKSWLLEHTEVGLPKEGLIPSVTLGGASAETLLASVGLDLAGMYKIVKAGEALKPRALDATAKVSVVLDEKRKRAQNVVAVLEGTDPKLKDEYVSFSAHYDHVDMNSKGEIYPGADDDGSGTSAVLEIAEAMSVQRPRRSVFVIFHSAEELGLLGSEYNSDIAPVIPLEKIVVNLNIDMIGRSKKPGDTDARNKELTDANSIYVIGADKLSRELHEISEQTNSEFERMRFDYAYNDPNHPQRFYYRSDHWNYAKHGIPVIFYFSGVHEDYHQPTDTIDKIDFEKMAKVTRLIYQTGWRVANLDHRIKVD